MTLSADNLSTNLLVTALVLLMVFVLPWADRRICKRMGLNLRGGVSTHPRADALLRLRRQLLAALFAVYLLALAYIVFFSRSATRDYQVHVALFEDLHNAVQIDIGFLSAVRAFFTEGLAGGLSHIRVNKPEDITQVYMNVMLFVPMGYLLPYLSDWFRAKVSCRPVLACFAVSLLIENAQLIAKRGFYDLDDLVSNTAGGLIGQLLFISAAYVVTHPDWRRELAAYRRWKRNARRRTLYPFAHRIALSRTTLRATREEDIWDFYVMKLGFRLRRQLVPLDSDGTDILLEMGRSQVVIHCSNRSEELGEQELVISARHLNSIVRRLRDNGIDPGEISQDPYTDRRRIRFRGPDGVCITVLED